MGQGGHLEYGLVTSRSVVRFLFCVTNFPCGQPLTLAMISIHQLFHKVKVHLWQVVHTPQLLVLFRVATSDYTLHVGSLSI